MFSNPLILVGTDFSPISDLALKAAEALRQKANGRLHVIHIMKYPAEMSWLSNFELLGSKDKMFKASESQLAEQIKQCEVNCTQEVISGRPYKILHDTIKTKGVDVLVLGHRGGSDDHYQTGGLTTKMVSTSEVPVLVINKEFDLNKVVGLVDPLEPVKSIFSTSEEYASLFSAGLEFISVWPDISAQTTRRSPIMTSKHESYTEEEKKIVVDDVTKMLQENIKEGSKALTKVFITENKKTSEGLVRAMEGSDLAVMNRHSRGLVEKLLIGSVTRKVIDSFRGNLLILPPVNND